MADMTRELKVKLLAAKNVEEVAALLKDAGAGETRAEQLWAEIEHKRETNGKELDLEELEVISGGRNWKDYGCAATVEPNDKSWCWTNDQCYLWDVIYHQGPINIKCPRCGGYLCHDDYAGPETVSRYGNWLMIDTLFCRVCGYREANDGTDRILS